MSDNRALNGERYMEMIAKDKLTLRQLARRLGIPRGTVASNISYARQKRAGKIPLRWPKGREGALLDLLKEGPMTIADGQRHNLGRYVFAQLEAKGKIRRVHQRHPDHPNVVVPVYELVTDD